jgi:hypothetical protein
MSTIAGKALPPGIPVERRAGRGIGGSPFDYQRQVEMIMKAPRERALFTSRGRERLATSAVILAIVVSLAGACVVIVESTVPAPQKTRSATH